jgi:hypothetical protein
MRRVIARITVGRDISKSVTNRQNMVSIGVDIPGLSANCIFESENLVGNVGIRGIVTLGFAAAARRSRSRPS